MTAVVIAAHEIADTYSQEEIELDDELIDSSIPHEAARKKAAPLGRYFDAMITAAGRYMARKEPDRARRMLGVGVDCAVALFSGSGHEGPVAFSLEGKPLTSAGGPLHSLAEVSLWINALTLSLALRRSDAVEVILRYSDDKLRSTPSSATGDTYRSALASGLRGFLQGTDTWQAALAEAERLSRPENLKVATAGLVNRFRNLIPIVQAIHARDQAAFTRACGEAVLAHRMFYTQGREVVTPNGLLAYQAAGIAALGVDRGLVYEVESAYTPGWLVLGGQP